ETQAAWLVLAETEMVVQEIARGIPRHLVERAPARLGIERIVEELLHPRREEILAGAVPVAGDRPHSGRSLARRWPPVDAERATRRGRGVVAERDPVRPRAVGGYLTIPPVGRAAAPLRARDRHPRSEERRGGKGGRPE